MKKIVAAFDGLQFSQSTLEHAIYFTRHAQAHLVGVFLDDFTYNSYSFNDITEQDGGLSDERLKHLTEQDRQTRDWAAQLFEETCTKAGISFDIHRDKNIALQELLHESIYSDLLIIDKKETFTRFKKPAPTPFLQDLLSDVQCPVLVVPSQYTSVEKVLLLYDGQPSSVYAIKMFSYMLPVLKSERIEVLTVKSEKEPLHVPDEALMREFMKRHYPLADFNVKGGDAEDEILNYLRGQDDNLLVVLGAYRRGRVSRWFKPSMADQLIQNLKAPLFIAHN